MQNKLPQRIESKKEPDKNLAYSMKLWGKIMGSLRMVPYVKGKGWAGNISFRENKIIWVTSAGCTIGDIKPEDIVGIAEKGGKIVFWGHSDKKPTSEWEIHWGIFKKRRDVGAILHGHDPFALETAEKLNENYPEDAALTKSVTEAGSPEFRDDVLDVLTNKNSYLIGKEHGFFALGRTLNESGMLALEFRSRANELLMGKGAYKALLAKYKLG